MQIPINDILAFHKLRTTCHINCMNYFAGLLGAHFPEHDNDKMSGPCCIGYAYINYANYHPNCKILPAQADAQRAARDEHHRTQPHHIEHYACASDIPDIRLAEMVADWHSANFEQLYIQHRDDYESVSQFFDAEMKQYNWTPHQLNLIEKYIDIINRTANHDAIMATWQPIMM